MTMRMGLSPPRRGRRGARPRRRSRRPSRRLPWPFIQSLANVQRIVNDLHKEGLVAFQPNPHHRRAKLVVLTGNGRRAYEDAVATSYPRADALAEGLSETDIRTAHRAMVALRKKLEGENDAKKPA
jgi:hypothetical protein